MRDEAEFRKQMLGTFPPNPDFSFTDRPMKEWTFEEAKLWEKILRDGEFRSLYREYLASKSVVIRKAFDLCREDGMTDHATQDRVALILLEKMQRDEQTERFQDSLGRVAYRSIFSRRHSR